MFKPRTTEQEACLKNGRIIVNIQLALAVNAENPEDAKIVSEQWLNAINEGNLERANDLRRHNFSLLHWESLTDYEED